MRAAVAALVLLAGCSSAGPAATPTTTTTATATSTSSPRPSTLVPALEELWTRTPSTSCLVVGDDAGRFLFERNPDLPVIPASTTKLLLAAAAADRTTATERIRRMLLDSDNDAARSLFDEVGARGVVEALHARGLPVDGAVVADGTGHDRTNRVTCRLLTAILEGATPTMEAALPVAGRSGTLAGRFVGTPVDGHLRAKTGSIPGVAALAGFADAADGGTLTFAFVANGVDPGQGSRLQDELGHHLVLRQP